MQISVATSVLHDGTQQDLSSHPAVTTPSEMKHWWNNKSVEIGSCTEMAMGDAGDQCQCFLKTIQQQDDRRTSLVLFAPSVQLVCAENVIHNQHN